MRIQRKHQTDTKFSRKWGVIASEIAKKEETTIDAIHMRVLKWGHPFQRASKPSKYEIITGKTIVEIALACGTHPQTCIDNYNKYRQFTHPKPGIRGSKNKGQVRGLEPWYNLPNFTRVKPWLMEEHPDYDYFRNCSYDERLQYLKDKEII